MKNWWKSPVLQGDDNDYGQYDYLIEEIPNNTAKWDWYRQNCDECGKEHRLNITYTGYFRTMDGWDSMDSCECLLCYLKERIKRPFRVCKKNVKVYFYVKNRIREYNMLFKKCTGKPLTKEKKKLLSKLFSETAAY